MYIFIYKNNKFKRYFQHVLPHMNSLNLLQTNAQRCLYALNAKVENEDIKRKKKSKQVT